jgi:hypothetical protein
MRQFGIPKPRRTVVKYYGRGSLLGVWSLFIAYLMAQQGMNGWQQRALRDMERDTVEMDRRGYRVVSTEEYSMPIFGISYFKVAYELADPR